MKRNSDTAHPVEGALENLAEDARALLSATAEVAEDKVVEARRRLANALERGRDVYERVHDKALQGARATDEMVWSHPYQAIGIAFGVGALLGFLLTRRN
jgi:ElaB/YqjD/DUF883 family membrane-anchored ribosome-binding protein